MTGLTSTKILKRTDWTNALTTLSLDISADFIAGQFFNLGLQIGDQVVRRSYSAASAPNSPLEFFVSRVTTGGFTPSLFELQVGELVLIDEKALGFFTLREVPEAKRLWLVATGTGLGPYISMLRSGAFEERFEQVVFVHGARHANELAYFEELREAEKSHPKYTYVPLLSGPDEASDSALLGRITTAWDNASLEERAGAFDEDCHMLLCGNPRMIEDMTERLKERGFEKHRRRKPGHFNFEKYW